MPASSNLQTTPGIAPPEPVVRLGGSGVFVVTETGDGGEAVNTALVAAIGGGLTHVTLLLQSKFHTWNSALAGTIQATPITIRGKGENGTNVKFTEPMNITSGGEFKLVNCSLFATITTGTPAAGILVSDGVLVLKNASIVDAIGTSTITDVLVRVGAGGANVISSGNSTIATSNPIPSLEILAPTEVKTALLVKSGTLTLGSRPTEEDVDDDFFALKLTAPANDTADQTVIATGGKLIVAPGAQQVQAGAASNKATTFAVDELNVEAYSTDDSKGVGTVLTQPAFLQQSTDISKNQLRGYFGKISVHAPLERITQTKAVADVTKHSVYNIVDITGNTNKGTQEVPTAIAADQVPTLHEVVTSRNYYDAATAPAARFPQATGDVPLVRSALPLA